MRDTTTFLCIVAVCAIGVTAIFWIGHEPRKSDAPAAVEAPAPAPPPKPPSEWTVDREDGRVKWRPVPGGRLYVFDGYRGAGAAFVPEAR